MPHTTLRFSLIAIIAVCLSSFGLAQDPSRLSPADEAALRAAVEAFFTAYAGEDLEGVTRLWSAKSPELEAHKKKLQGVFAETDKIEVIHLAVRKVLMEEKAKVRVDVEISAIETKTGKPATDFGKMNRLFYFVREDGKWRLWRELAAEEEFAAALVAAKTDDERAALLGAEKELVTVELRKALIAQGDPLRRQGNYPQALNHFRLAHQIAEQIGDKPGIASALHSIGNVNYGQGNYAVAVENYQKSLALRESLGDKRGIASSLQNIGNIHYAQSNYALALEYYQKSRTMREELGDKEGVAGTLNNIGEIHRLQSDYDLAMEHHRKSLAIREELGDRSGIAASLDNMGIIHQQQGNYGLALEHHQKSLALHEAVGERVGIANGLGNIGNVHFLQGNYDLALDYYQKGLKLREAMGDKSGLRKMLMNIGVVHRFRGNYGLALEYTQKSLTLGEELGEKGGIAQSLSNIAVVHRSQGNYVLALEYYEKSLALTESIGEKLRLAETLKSVAILHSLQGDHTRALEFAERSASIARQIGNLEALWEARSAAGKAYYGLNQLTKAQDAFEEAMATIETLRAQVIGGVQDRERYFETRVSPYYAMIELSIAQNKADDALSYAERAKARVLLDVLRSGRVNITKAMTLQEQERERRARNELASLNTQISRENLRTQPDQARLADLQTHLQASRLDYEAFQTSLYAAHPELKAQRGEAQPMSLNEIRALFPDAKSALLEYVVTEEKTFLFVLTKGNPGSQKPVDLKLYTLEIKRKDLQDRTERFRQQLARRDLSFGEGARDLYELLLGPARKQMQGKASLVIVPDAALWDLPFQALRTAPNRYLIEDHAVSYAPSLTVLREMMRARRKTPNRATKPATFLAFGNPVLGKQTVARARSVLLDETLDPLPEAETQVKALGRLYGVSQSKVYVGLEAREERFKAEAWKYRILQLATHGILNDASPMYSHVVLAQGEGSGKEDGLLEAWEMMNLDLNADLVVLSACETARGRVGAGEGVIGLTWALFVAGTPTTVVSQWKVESASTTALMLEFHRNLQSRINNSKSAVSTSRALQQAATKMLRSKEYRHPFYWAGFVVVGDGR